ncbi:hypothetical protein L2E82_18883 [Cichorium intybus]|uniref:Uncharacterized protein n=1 Tax=Cichorium intybus TaxID=13427 RepID=A0ACB9FC99_CICIN|nr:hypothetical protein L2E82_18883 [Cichorium intybus]
MTNEEFNEFSIQQPSLKRSVSAGSGVPVSGFYLNPSSPSGSDVSDSSVPGFSPSHVYRPVPRTPSEGKTPFPPVNDPPTSLSLSLPGAEYCEASSMSHPPPLPKPAPIAISAAMQQLQVSRQPCAATEQPEKGLPPFSAEFLSVMQEMVRMEVRNYITGVELQQATNGGG